MQRKRYSRATAVVAVLALGLAACGDDDSADSTSAESGPTSTAPGDDSAAPSDDSTAATDDSAAPGDDSAAPGGDSTGTTSPGGSGLEFGEAGGDVRGFDGTTVRLASLGIVAQFPGAEWGVQGRIERFNDTDEIPGIELEYVESADDQQDPALALSEARRLVTSENVFAIVGDTSQSNPADYLEQQGVPYFGWAFDNSYCSDEPDPDVWGFGFNGCLVPDEPAEMPDSARHVYDYVAEETGNDSPTVALFSSDTESGKNSTRYQAASWAGAGFDVVYADGPVPLPPVSDYTPYIQELLSSADGSQPDVMVCLLAADCIPMYAGLTAAGYTGVYHHNVYSDLVVEPMDGSTVSAFWAVSNTAGLEPIMADIAAVNSDQPFDTAAAAGYFSTDMFIAALKTVAAEGNEYISPENVQRAAANQTWEIEGVIGPVQYPDSTVMGTPYCSELLQSDGTEWVTVTEYDCSDVRHPLED